MSSSELLNSLGPKLLSGRDRSRRLHGGTWSKHTNLTLPADLLNLHQK